MMTKYFSRMIVHDDAITFEIADLPGFFVQADSTDPTAAIAEAEAVLAEYTGAMLDAGQDLPIPSDFLAAARLGKERFEPFDEEANSATVVLTARPTSSEPVRVNVSIDRRTLAAIDHSANARGLTRSAYLAEAARAFG